MTTFTKEQLIEHLRSRIEHRKGLIASIHIDRGYRDYLKLELRSSEIALASLEAEGGLSNLVASQESLGGDFEKVLAENIEELYVPGVSVPPAPVSVPAAMEMDDDFDSAFEHGKAVGWNACRSAMLQGAEPVTTKDDGGRSGQDDSPECGWVVTHSGKDYFYREQKDAVTHMNSAVESGLGVSLRSFIPEPVTTAYKLRDAVDAIRNSGIAIDAEKILAERDALNYPVIPDGWVMAPVDMTPEQIRAVQLNSELGAYAASNLTGAYSLFREFWDVAIAAAPKQE